MLFAGGSIGNDLLGFVPTKAYFKAAGIEMNVAALSEVLDAPVPEAAAARPGDSARRQLALRALGELKDEAALPIIEKHSASADRFIADYAKAARAAIKGEKYSRSSPGREVLRQDLACLPSGVGVIGRLSATSGGSGVELIKQMKSLDEQLRKRGGHVLGGGDVEKMEAEMVERIGKPISMLGNVRLSAVTFGVASEVGNNKGFVVGLARGLYDREAVVRLFGELGAGEVLKAGGLTFHEIERGKMYVAPVSDELLVFAAGASLEEIPLAEVGKKVSAGGGDFAIGRDLAMLLDRADTSVPVWVLMKVSEAYKQVPFLAPFDTVVLQGKQADGGKAKLSLTGKGKDPEAVAMVAEQLNGMLKEARAKMAEETENFPPAKIVGDMLKSVGIEAEGGVATMTGELPEGGVMSILPMVFFGYAAPLHAPVGPDAAIPEHDHDHAPELKEAPEEAAVPE